MMHTHLFIVFSLSSIFNILLPIQFATQKENQYKHIKVTPFYEREIPEDINNEVLKQHSEQTKKADIFTEKDIAEMKIAVENSPKKALHIVDQLENHAYSPYNLDNRLAIFFGDAESNSKRMAQVIAYRMYKQGWNIEVFCGESLFGKNSDHTAIKVANALNNIETLNKPTLIVFFDLDQPLGYHQNQYRDPDSIDTKPLFASHNKDHHYPELTNIVFLNFLIKQRSNEKFFLIGTMKDIQKLPQDTKNRIIMNIIEFPSHQ